MIRILHLADVHLGASFSAFGPVAEERQRQHLGAFRGLPNIAEEEDADGVVVAGDLFDGPGVSPELTAAVRETFRRLRAAGCPVFVIPGNHDSLTIPGTPYRDDLGGARIFTAPVFGAPASIERSGEALHVYGFAFDPARVRDPLATYERADRAGVHLVLLHGPVPDAPHWGRSPNALSLPPDRLGDLDADYLALGDYHRPRLPDGFDGIPAAYAGSFAATDLTETGPRGLLVVDLEAGASPTVRLRPSGVPPVHDAGEVDVSGCASDLEVAEVVAGRVPEGAIPSVALTGEPGFPLDDEVVHAELAARFGHAGVRDQTRYYASVRLQELGEEDTVIGHAVRLGRERIRAAGREEERQAAERALRIVLRSLEVE